MGTKGRSTRPHLPSSVTTTVCCRPPAAHVTLALHSKQENPSSRGQPFLESERPVLIWLPLKPGRHGEEDQLALASGFQESRDQLWCEPSEIPSG